MRKLLIFTLVLISLLSSLARAEDIYAVSGRASDIQDAVNQAGVGDNVHIPEGTFNFYEPGDSWVAVEVPPGINIFGAPTERDANDQVIEWKTRLIMPFIPPENARFFNINGDSDPNKSIRFSDIEMVGYRAFHLNDPGANTNTSIARYRGMVITNVVDFRIDHCFFNETADGGIWVGGEADCNARGVIDHSKFINKLGIPHGPWNTSDPGQAYRERTLGYGIGIGCVGSSIWDPNIENILGQYGTSKTTREINVAGSIYIEDNYFSRWRHCVSSGHGSHYVFRHNIIENDCGGTSVDAHGVYVHVGTRAMEVYDNQFLDAVNCWEGQNYWLNRNTPAVIGPRGPVGGIVFNNYVSGYRLHERPQDEPQGHGVFLHHLPEGGYPTDWWYWNNTLEPNTTPFWNWAPQYYYFVEPWPTLFPAELPGPTSQNVSSITYEPYPYPHPLTLENITYTVNITGIVTDSETSLPIQDVIVACNFYSDTTNSTGGYFIMTSYPAPGSCTLTARKGDYNTMAIPSFQFLENTTYRQDFMLDPIKYKIKGRLKDKDDNPIEADITAYQPDTITVVNSTQTSNGYYDLTVRPGTYDIEFNISEFIPNYYIKIKSVDVNSNFYDMIKYINKTGLKEIAFAIEIGDGKEIETYSKDEPTKILLNNSEIENVSSLAGLRKNTWYHDFPNNKLNMNVNPDLMTDCLAKFDCCKDEVRYYDKSCPSDNYCSDRICYPKQSCPYECCLNDEAYFDKQCSSGYYCSENQCMASSAFLVGYWTFDENSGTTAGDSSNNNNHGTINEATWASDCHSGYCLSFDGSNDYVAIPYHSGLDMTQEFTIEAWVYPIGPGSNEGGWGGGIVSKMQYVGDSPPTIGYNTVLFTDQKLHTRLNDDGVYSTSTIPYKEWTHVATVYDGSNIILYINGQEDNRAPFSGTIETNDCDLLIGNSLSCRHTGSRAFNGRIDEVKIYNQSLTADDISAHV